MASWNSSFSLATLVLLSPVGPRYSEREGHAFIAALATACSVTREVPSRAGTDIPWISATTMPAVWLHPCPQKRAIRDIARNAGT